MWQIPPPTFRIAALSPARAPQADREMASPFTPGKRSGTKVPHYQHLLGEVLHWNGRDIIYAGLTHSYRPEMPSPNFLA